MAAAGSIRARVASYAADASAVAVDQIAAAVARGDDDDAIARVVARLAVGEATAPTTTPTSIDDVIDALPGAPGVSVMLSIVGKVGGDRAGALLAAVERGCFPAMYDLRALEIGALLAAWRLGDQSAIRGRIARQMRRLVRTELDEVAAGLALALARELGDAHVSAEAKLFKVHGELAVAERALALMTEPVSELIAALPDSERGAASSGFTVRATERPGRNEPCHCGSGKKYKKCHADEDDAAAATGAASPIAGMSWDDYLTRGAPQLTVEDLQKLPLADLARLDLDGLAAKPLFTAYDELCAFRRWGLAERVIAAIRRRPAPVFGDAIADDHVADLVEQLLVVGDYAGARDVATRIGDPTKIAATTHVALSIGNHAQPDATTHAPADALDQLETLAVAAVTRDDANAYFELATALLGVRPALGIVVARGALDARRVSLSETMLDVVEEARDRLGLPPGDPGWTVWDDLLSAAGVDPRKPTAGRRPADAAEDERHALAREAAALRATLHAEADRAAKLESELALQRAALAVTTAARGASAGAGADAEAVARARELRERVEVLESRIREGNEERVELRRKLEGGARRPGRGEAGEASTASVGAPAAAAAVPTPEDEDAAEGVEALASTTTGRRAIIVPRFEDAAIRAIGSIPASVAAEALRTISELAAGDGLAWHRVKQARDMRTPLFMARVGIHHRLLFRVDDRLAIIDVVPREGLLHALKRLRSG